MPRSRQFDRDEALQAATQLFRGRGYAGTSADELVKAMGIARQSLYDVFGSKRELYLEALRTYNSGSVAELIQLLREEASPLAALRRMLLVPVLLAEDERLLGCFGINAICEFGVSDAGVSGAAASSFQLDAALSTLIEEGQRKGEISDTIGVWDAKNFLSCVLAGLKVGGRAGASPDALKTSVDLALRSLQASREQ